MMFISIYKLPIYVGGRSSYHQNQSINLLMMMGIL